MVTVFLCFFSWGGGEKILASTGKKMENQGKPMEKPKTKKCFVGENLPKIRGLGRKVS